MPDAANRPTSVGNDAQAAIEGNRHGAQEPGGSKDDAPANPPPPAGPHADPKLMNEDATPGAGTLEPVGRHDDVDSTSG
jgi:hypothetical protein